MRQRVDIPLIACNLFADGLDPRTTSARAPISTRSKIARPLRQTTDAVFRRRFPATKDWNVPPKGCQEIERTYVSSTVRCLSYT